MAEESSITEGVLEMGELMEVIALLDSRPMAVGRAMVNGDSERGSEVGGLARIYTGPGMGEMARRGTSSVLVGKEAAIQAHPRETKRSGRSVALKLSPDSRRRRNDDTSVP